MSLQPITPQQAKQDTFTGLSLDDAVTDAYNELIWENFDPNTNASSFSQGTLVGRLSSNHRITTEQLITQNRLRPAPGFVDVGWVIEPDYGFYTEVRNKAFITFKIKT